MKEHKPDIAKIPEPLRSLNWIERQDEDVFSNGETLLVAVPVCNRHGGGWYYELSCVTIHCDEESFDVDLHGEDWGWTWIDVDLFVRLTPAPTQAEVDEANGIGV